MSRRTTAALCLQLSLVAAACGGSSKGAIPKPCPTVSTITSKDGLHFVPKCATVTAGEIVTWRNTDGVPHTVTFTTGYDFDEYYEADETVTLSFEKTGVFDYYCKVHGRIMTAKLVVKAAS